MRTSAIENEGAVVFGYTLATPKERLKAFRLEMLVMVGPLLAINLSMYEFIAGHTILFIVLADVIWCTLSGLISYSLWSGNIGHKLCGLKVVSSIDGSNFNRPLHAIAREQMRSALCCLVFPAIGILRGQTHQAMHDKIVRSYVVKK